MAAGAQVPARGVDTRGPRKRPGSRRWAASLRALSLRGFASFRVSRHVEIGGAWPDCLIARSRCCAARLELEAAYLVKALDSYGYFALSEVFTTYFSEFGVSDVAAGTYYGAWGTAITAYGVATGFAIDAMGVRRSLVACYALQTLARLILAFTTNKTVASSFRFTIQALATSRGAPVMTIAIKRLVADADRVGRLGDSGPS